MADRGFLSLSIQKNSAARYLLAFALMLVALLVARVLDPLLGTYPPYVIVFPALAFVAWYCGVGPSVVATLLALAGLRYWFMTPLHPLATVTTQQTLELLICLVASAIVIAMGEARRRENESLRRAQGELEDRVRQRTAELDAANQGLRSLTAHLMQSQDDERRRIARELHDSVGQTLAALAMNLTTVGVDVERLRQIAGTIADSASLVEMMNKEVRTISYLLHPPLLDEAGLVSALRWYIDGFVQRSKIEVDLQVPDDFGRCPRELEMAIFRTVQECLTNIHRHSGSPTATIQLSRFDGEVRLQVEDYGSGMPTDEVDDAGFAATPGVGIRGMRERLLQLGGTLEINSNISGTVVEARLPITPKWSAAA